MLKSYDDAKKKLEQNDHLAGPSAAPDSAIAGNRCVRCQHLSTKTEELFSRFAPGTNNANTSICKAKTKKQIDITAQKTFNFNWKL